MAKNHCIEFEGEKYYRNKQGYYETSRSRGRLALHRSIWQSANGPIPNGKEIHHIDFDPSNNVIGNLECLTRKEHSSRHEASGAFALPFGARSAMRSAEWKRREPRALVCCQCGDEYKSIGQTAMFCSRKCRRLSYNRKHQESISGRSLGLDG